MSSIIHSVQQLSPCLSVLPFLPPPSSSSPFFSFLLPLSFHLCTCYCFFFTSHPFLNLFSFIFISRLLDRKDNTVECPLSHPSAFFILPSFISLFPLYHLSIIFLVSSFLSIFSPTTLISFYLPSLSCCSFSLTISHPTSSFPPSSLSLSPQTLDVSRSHTTSPVVIRPSQGWGCLCYTFIVRPPNNA